MRTKALKTAFFIALLLSAPVYAENIPLSPTINAFAQAYIAALHANSGARLQALTDPKSVACILKASPIWFDQEAFTYAHSDMTAAPEIKLENFTLPIPEGAVFPDKPQKLLTLTWRTGTDFKGGQTVAQLAIVETETGIFRTLPCPTADIIKLRDAFFERRGYKPPVP